MKVPFDTELETSIIGTTIVYGTVSPMARGISPLEFFHPLNQKIWTAILAQAEDGHAVDVFDLKKRIDDDSVTALTLTQMTHGLPFTTISADEVKRLQDLATMRRMMHVFHELTEKASSKVPVLDVVEEAQMFLDTIKDQQDTREGTSQTLIEVMEYEVFPRLDKFVSGEMVKVPFGFESLDNSTNGGAALGELVVFGSNPKSGKSVMMLQTARNIAERGLPTLVVSLEMLNYENGFRMLAQTSRFSVNIFRPNLAEFASNELKAHAQEQYKLPLRFDQRSRTIKEVGKEVARLKEQEGLTAVFVDYVQLIKSDKRNIGRVERIEDAMVDLKELAMKHEVVVYTAAQFNREGIKSERPTLAHFDGSSAIEKTANLGLLWVLDKEFDNVADGRNGKLWIEMGRSVGTDEFDIVFHGKEAKFTLR